MCNNNKICQIQKKNKEGGIKEVNTGHSFPAFTVFCGIQTGFMFGCLDLSLPDPPQIKCSLWEIAAGSYVRGEIRKKEGDIAEKVFRVPVSSLESIPSPWQSPLLISYCCFFFFTLLIVFFDCLVSCCYFFRVLFIYLFSFLFLSVPFGRVIDKGMWALT